MTVESRFAEIGARAKVRDIPARRATVRRWRPNWLGPQPRPQPPAPRLDVRRDRKGEYFDIAVPEGVEVEVLDADKSARHLLLLARLTGRVTSSGGEGRDAFNVVTDKARYLCGHDERHWFVAAVPENYPASNVAEAKVALQPRAVRDLAATLPKAKRTARKNEVYRRQGEWFFLPAPDFEPAPHDVILHNEPLSRGAGSTPHVVADMVRSGGRTVWLADRASLRAWPETDRTKEIRETLSGRVFTPGEQKQMAERFPEVSWASRLADPTVYVRGTVRHSDHATIDLKGWHRVVMSAENQARAASHVVFLD